MPQTPKLLIKELGPVIIKSSTWARNRGQYNAITQFLWFRKTRWESCFSIGMLIIALPFIQDLVAQRGEKLELLIDKTENLVDSVSSEDGGVNPLGSALS